MKERALSWFGRANERQTVSSATLTIAVAYLLSRILGLLRDRLLVSHFGKGELLDAYNAAFRLPDLLFTLLVSGAFAVAFIPVFTEFLERDDRATAWRVASSMLTLLVTATVFGGVVLMVFADPLMRVVAPGFSPEQHAVTVELTRIMAITPVFFAISSVLGSIQQSLNRFTFYAFAGVLYNLGIIAGVVWLAPRYSVYGVAWGVVLGVILQAGLQWLGLMGLGFRFRPDLGLKLAGVTRTIRLMVPRALDQGADQLQYAVETVIGSTLTKGSITALTLASNLKNVPLVLIASSITTAVFPRLAARAAQGTRERLVEAYTQTARLILFLAIPSAVFVVVTRGYLVRLLYGFSDADTASTLGWFAGTIVFTSLFMLVGRVFYSLQDTKTPLYVSLVSIPSNMLLGFGLSRIYGVAGLAMAASVVAGLELGTLMILLRRRQTAFREAAVARAGLPMAVAGAIMGLVLYAFVSRIVPLYAQDRGFITLAPKFGLIVLVGATAYLVPCFLMQLPEAREVTRRLRLIVARSLNLNQ